MHGKKQLGRGTALKNTSRRDADAPHFCGNILCSGGRLVGLELWLTTDADGNSCFYAELCVPAAGEDPPDPDAFDPRLRRAKETLRRRGGRKKRSRMSRMVAIYRHYYELSQNFWAVTTPDNISSRELETVCRRRDYFLMKITCRDPLIR